MSFLEIFSPSLRHLREERQRSQRAVDYPEGAGGAPLGIDLESGTARIPIRRTVPENEVPENEVPENEVPENEVPENEVPETGADADPS